MRVHGVPAASTSVRGLVKQAADVGTMPGQTIAGSEVDTGAASKASTQAAVDAIVAQLNEIRTNTRTAGQMA